METSRCKAFLAAAELGSLSAAADKLGYTPSGVSQLISALETDLGFSLLHRTRKGVKITSEGGLMIPLVRAFIQQENILYENAADILGLNIGTITVAAYSSVATHWLPKVISDFKRLYPNIQINLLEGIRQEVIKWLDEGIADIGILSGGDDITHEWIPLAEDPMIAVLPMDHPLAEADKFPLEKCNNEPFIMPARGSDNDVMRLFNKYDIVPDIAYSTNESFSAWAMVENGLGISITNALLMKGWKCDVARVPVEPAENITLGITLASFDNASPAVKRFVEYTESLLKQ